MGFSAYILESLRRYGKAEIGSWGSFILDYTPASWSVTRQSFEPPKASLQWLPGNSGNLNAMASVVSRLHEVDLPEASRFLGSVFRKFEETLAQKQPINLGILGQLREAPGAGGLEFLPEANLLALFEFAPLKLNPLPAPVPDKSPRVWLWLALVAIALTLASLFIYFLNIPSPQISATKAVSRSATSLKEVNIAPHTSDTAAGEEEVAEASPLIQERIIITGTFCKTANINHMKEKIQYMQYRLYEEKVNEECVRLGIYVYEEEDLELTLKDIRMYIEPTAWVLH